MFRAHQIQRLLMDRNTGDNQGGGTSAPPAPLAGAEGTPPPIETSEDPPEEPPAGSQSSTDEPFAIFHDKKAFEERMARHTRSQLNEIFGTGDKAELRKMWDNYQKLQKDDEERRRAEMTEIERHKADAEKAQADAAAAREEADQVRFESHVSAICAKKGIKNVDYAKFVVANAADALPEGEQLDVDEFLTQELAENSATRAAFQVEGPPVEQPTGTTTTPNPETPPPAAPPAGGTAPAPTDATKMSPEQFRQHLSKLGVGQPGT